MAGLLDFFTGNQNGVGILGLPPAMVSPFQGALQQIANPGLYQQQQASQQFNQMLPQLMGQPQAMPQQAMPQQPAQPSAQPPNFGNAIASIESGGKYDALGPETKGDRAYGKYQVMGNNIGPWTQEALGRAMTPQEFLASPQAQDAVFQKKFGSYVQKYGPEGAAKAWFAGEGGMNNPNAKDILGTTVASYAQKFNGAMGGPQGGAMPQMASAGAQVPIGTTIDQGPLPQQPPQMPPQMAQAPQQPMQPRPILPPAAINAAKMMLIPNLGKKQYEFASKLFDRALEDSKLTDAQKNHFRAQIDPSFARFNRPPEMKMLKDDLGNEVPYSFDQNSQSLQPIPVPGVQGASPPEKMVKELREEIQGLPSYKNIAQAAPVYKSMLSAAGRNNRAADVNMIYGMAKIMDPGSVVRESEMTIAQAVATLPQHYQATIMSQLQSTGRLSPEVRAAIMQEAHSRITAYKDMFDNDASQFRGIAQRRRMNLQDVLPNFGEFKEWTPKADTPSDRVNKWIDLGGGVRMRERP